MKRCMLTITIGLALAVAMPLVAFAGPLPTGTDADADGIDDGFDNCLGLINADQADADHNGCGDPCTNICDINQDGATTGADFGRLAACFGSPASCDPAADCNGDGAITGADFGMLASEFGTASGPSGLLAQFKTSSCP